MELENTSKEYRENLLNLLLEREKYKKYNKIETFEAYEFQKNFYRASKNYKRRFLCAANR